MKNSLVKRTLSIVLSAIMLVSCAVSVFAATENNSIDPVIIVGGIDANPLIANPNSQDAETVFPPSDAEMNYFIGKLITLMNTAVASNNYDEILNYTYSWVYPIMDKISMNNDGTKKSNNVGVQKYTHSLSYYRTDAQLLEKVAGTLGKGMAEKLGYNNIYVFQYDWRLDPFDNANSLAEFVKEVKAASHKDQVSIVSEGYGANVAVTYLSEHSETAHKDVSKFVTVSSAFMGTSLIGDLFTGNLIVKDSTFSYPNNVGYGQFQNLTSAYIRWSNDFSDNPITAFSTWLTNYILNGEWETQSYIINIMTMMGHTITKMYDKYLREMLRNYLGLWAMVPLEYYDDAYEYMFIDREEPNASLVKKINAYKKLQKSASSILTDAQKAGIDVSVVAMWDLQLLPIGNDYMPSESGNDERDINDMSNELYGLSAQSDGVIDTYYASFGAYCTALNDVGRAALIMQAKDKDHDHLSKTYDSLDPKHKFGAICHYIDASTCALPENTYFIRNMKHGSFQEGSNTIDLIDWLACDDDTNINARWELGQFMTINRYVDPAILVVDSDKDKNGQYLLGDVNLDGKVTAADARLALRIAANLDPMPAEDSVQFKNADVNNDKKLTAQDARTILRVVARLQNF